MTLVGSPDIVATIPEDIELESYRQKKVPFESKKSWFDSRTHEFKPHIGGIFEFEVYLSFERHRWSPTRGIIGRIFIGDEKVVEGQGNGVSMRLKPAAHTQEIHAQQPVSVYAGYTGERTTLEKEGTRFQIRHIE